MADRRPSLDVLFGVQGVAATVTLPGYAPVSTSWVEQKPAGEPYPTDSGAYSLSKSQRRGSLRLDQLPPAPRPDVSWPPPGTTIELGETTLSVVGVDYQDDRVAHVIASA